MRKTRGVRSRGRRGRRARPLRGLLVDAIAAVIVILVLLYGGGILGLPRGPDVAAVGAKPINVTLDRDGKHFHFVNNDGTSTNFGAGSMPSTTAGVSVTDFNQP